MPEVKRFRGLNNVADPLTLGLEWFTQADNCDLTREGKPLRCRGFASVFSGTMYGAYATEDEQRLYVVDGTSLKRVFPNFSTATLATVTAAPMHFAELNGQVFCTNGTDYLVIQDNVVRSWGIAKPDPPTVSLGSGILPAGEYQVVTTLVASDGRESANSDVVPITLTDTGSIQITNIDTASGYTSKVYVTEPDGTVFYFLTTSTGTATYNSPPEQLGVELPYFNTNPPRGLQPTFFKGRAYLAEWFPQLDATVVWRSLPLAFHQFHDAKEGFTVPGRVLMLAPSNELVIGTDREQYAWDERLTKIADYGVVSGFPSARLGNTAYWWSQRGLCTGMPFRNLTEGSISVAPGLNCAAVTMERDGHVRFVVALERGGSAYNPYS